MSLTEEQFAEVVALLLYKWEQEVGQRGPTGDETPPRPIIQVTDVQEQGWGRELSDEQARMLIEFGLESGGWYVKHPPITTAQGIRGYQYTDATTAARSQGYYRFRI